jgi:hypothetical protein
MVTTKSRNVSKFQEADINHILRIEESLIRRLISQGAIQYPFEMSDMVLLVHFERVLRTAGFSSTEMECERYLDQTKDSQNVAEIRFGCNNEAWDLFFARIRVLTYPMQVGSWLAALVLCLQGSLGYTSTMAQTQAILHSVAVCGTISVITMWLGHLWIPKPHRQLPLWSPLPHVNDLLRTRPWISMVLVMAVILLLLGSLVFSNLLVYGACALLLLSLLDLWRLLYTTYEIACLLALCCPRPDVSLSLVFGSLYAWAGFFKLVSKQYYSEVAPHSFAPVLAVLPRGWQELPALRHGIAAGAVSCELVMGIMVLLRPMCSLPEWVWLLTAAFNVAMHTYIILFIGIRNSIHTFIPWNCFCMAMTVTVLLAPPGNPAGSDSALMLLEWLYPILVCLCMNVPPVLQLVGRCDCPTLSHSYFVPFPSEPYHSATTVERWTCCFPPPPDTGNSWKGVRSKYWSFWDVLPSRYAVCLFLNVA